MLRVLWFFRNCRFFSLESRRMFRQDRQTPFASCSVSQMERKRDAPSIFGALVHRARTSCTSMFAQHLHACRLVVDSLFCIYWGSATSGSADYLYTSHFGAPPRFKPSAPIFDYYRLCAINWRFLDVRSRPSASIGRHFLFLLPLRFFLSKLSIVLMIKL